MRRTAIVAYSKERALYQLELNRTVRPMTMAEVLRFLAALPGCAAGSFSLIFLLGAIGMVLMDEAGSYEKKTLFLATCAILASIVYYAGDRFGWMIDCFAEFKERKSRC